MATEGKVKIVRPQIMLSNGEKKEGNYLWLKHIHAARSLRIIVSQPSQTKQHTWRWTSTHSSAQKDFQCRKPFAESLSLYSIDCSKFPNYSWLHPCTTIIWFNFLDGTSTESLHLRSFIDMISSSETMSEGLLQAFWWCLTLGLNET